MGLKKRKDCTQNNNIEKDFCISGALTSKKLLEYIPVMILTNISVLLLVSVDGLVVGNLVGEQALSSVSIFYPAIALIGVISAWVACGSATSLSAAMSKNENSKILHLKHTINFLTIASAVFIGIAQIPAVHLIINSYKLSPELHDLTWQYAIGVMCSMPFGLISNVGVYQLQIIGKMKMLGVLALIEGCTNLIFDLMFVKFFRMGVAGAGYGTLCANLVRSFLTVAYLAKKTGLYKCHGAKINIHDIKEILINGLPEASNSIMLAIQSYFMLSIIIKSFGEFGGAIKSCCDFSTNVALIFINSIQSSARPLISIMNGSEDYKGLRILIRQCVLLITGFIGIFTAMIWFFPRIVYRIHGINNVPNGAILSLRIYSVCFLLLGFNTLFRAYFSNCGQAKYSSILTIIGNSTLAFFALILSKSFLGSDVWLAYSCKELLMLSVNLCFYWNKLKLKANQVERNSTVLYMTVKPEDAIAASRQIRHYADDNSYPPKISNRISLAMEEMVAYAAKSQNNQNIQIQIVIRFFKDRAIFVMLDDGKCIALDSNNKIQELITDNYGLLKKVAKSVKYQYILNMNYTIFEF